MKADSCLWLSRKGCPARICVLSPFLSSSNLQFFFEGSVNKLRSLYRHFPNPTVGNWIRGGRKNKRLFALLLFPPFSASLLSREMSNPDRRKQPISPSPVTRPIGRKRKEKLIGFGLNYAEGGGGGTKNFRRRRLRCHTEMLSSREKIGEIMRDKIWRRRQSSINFEKNLYYGTFWRIRRRRKAKKFPVIDTLRAPQAFVGSTRRRRKGTGTRALCCSTQLQPHSVAPPSPNNHAGRYNMWKASGGEARKEKMRSIHPPLPLLRLFRRLLT